jgi:hypothetical protein
MDEIRRILIKVRSDRRRKDKTYVVINLELSSDDNTVNSNEEITETKLNYKSLLSQWIADTGATIYMINQLYLFRGSLKKVRKKLI